MLGRLLFSGGYVALMISRCVPRVLLSDVDDSTAGAVVGTVVAVVTSNVLSQLPGLATIKPFLFTRYWDEWATCTRPRHSTTCGRASRRRCLVDARDDLTIWRFQRKDVLS